MFQKIIEFNINQKSANLKYSTQLIHWIPSASCTNVNLNNFFDEFYENFEWSLSHNQLIKTKTRKMDECN